MRSTHLNTTWLWLLSGGLTLTLSGSAIAQETETQEKPAIKENEPAKDPLFPFSISKETTRITEPLKPDGTVDYAAALNARNSQGLSAEDNAGALLIKVFGVEDVPEDQREKHFQALGIPVPANTEGLLKDMGQIVKQHLQAKGLATDDNEAYQPFWDQQSKAMSRPWSRKDLPVVAKWVDANAEPIKLAVEASQKSRLFFPLIVPENGSLFAVNLDKVQHMRELARLLTARAMLALEEGRIDEAQRHLLACHRLASLLGQRGTLIEALVSYALDAVACRADLALAQSEKVTKAQLAAYRKKLADLPALPRISECIDHGERFFSLDAISQIAMQKMEGEDLGIPNSKLFQTLMRLSIDWDLILKRFNDEYDQMAGSLRLPTHAARHAAMEEMGEKLKKLRADANQPAKIALMLLGVNTPRAMVSQQMGDMLLILLLPAVEQASNAETRANTRRDQTQLALALAEYHRVHGQYPETLENLSPEYLKTIPKDRYTDKPLKYRTQDKGYLLYNLGPNGKDDQGQDRNAQNDADDWAIRVPIPPEL